jgi:hypothetical protein
MMPSASRWRSLVSTSGTVQPRLGPLRKRMSVRTPPFLEWSGSCGASSLSPWNVQCIFEDLIGGNQEDA